MASEPDVSTAQPPEPSRTEKRLTIIEEIQRVPDRIFKREAYMTLVLLLAGALVATVVLAQGDAWGGSFVEKKVAPVIKSSEEKQAEALRKANAEQKAALEKVKAELKADIAEVKQQAAVKEDRDARRFELMVNTVLTGQRQPGTKALTRPPADAGP